MLVELPDSDLPSGLGPGDVAESKPPYDAYYGMCHGERVIPGVDMKVNALAVNAP